MSQQQRMAARTLDSVRVTRPVPIEGPEDLEAVRRSIESGRAFLRVVEYPWGVEFDVSEVEGRE